MEILLATVAGWITVVAKSVFAMVKLNSMNVVSKEANGFGIDTSIEGMNSQEFSVAIFYFLVAAIVVFTIFVFMFMLKDKSSKLKTGERWMFVWILLGIVAAVVFGATQLLHGYLF